MIWRAHPYFLETPIYSTPPPPNWDDKFYVSAHYQAIELQTSPWNLKLSFRLYPWQELQKTFKKTPHDNQDVSVSCAIKVVR